MSTVFISLLRCPAKLILLPGRMDQTVIFSSSTSKIKTATNNIDFKNTRTNEFCVRKLNSYPSSLSYIVRIKLAGLDRTNRIG